MVRCGLFAWYINRVYLKIMIHIAEAETCVLDLTGWARQGSGPIGTVGRSYVFYVSLIRSIIRFAYLQSAAYFMLQQK
uniref:Secreted protein n=1 Tax=Schistosoma curassoni TaxID=6186 RepID=A0A183L6J0_9TREM